MQQAIRIARQHVRATRTGAVPAGMADAYRQADQHVLSKIQFALGLDQVRAAICGAAPVAPEVLEFMHALGIPVTEAWGMSECLIGTLNPPAAIRIGTVGTAAGKDISPANIEGAVLAASLLTAQIVAIGDRRPYITALIVLDPDAAAAFAARHGITDPTLAALAEFPAVRATVAAAVQNANGRLSRVEQIKRFAILPVSWEPGGDELTPTMKLKRQAITAKYGDIIESLYTAEGQPHMPRRQHRPQRFHEPHCGSQQPSRKEDPP